MKRPITVTALCLLMAFCVPAMMINSFMAVSICMVKHLLRSRHKKAWNPTVAVPRFEAFALPDTLE